MRRLFLVFVLFMALPLGAQNLKGFYVQKIHPDGLLYFVYPQKMAEMKGNMKLCRGSLLYDYTYLDARDSVTLLITVETNAVSIRILYSWISRMVRGMLVPWK